MPYVIGFELNESAVQAIARAGQMVTFVKGDPTEQTIAWLVFQATTSDIVVFDDTYSLFATASSPQSGSAIDFLAVTGEVQAGQAFSFSQSTFHPEGSGAGDGCSLFNQDGSAQYFGVAKSAHVDGQSFDTATTVTQITIDSMSTFSSSASVTIGLSVADVSGSVLGAPLSGQLSIDLQSKSMVSIGFDVGAMQFVLLS